MINGVPVFDVHSHLSMPSFTAGHLAAMMGVNSPLPNPLEKGMSSGLVGGRLMYADAQRSMPPQRQAELDLFAAEVDYHVDYIDQRSIDVQIVGPRPYVIGGWIEPHLLGAWSEYVNDLIALQCSLYATRFFGAAQLPMNAVAADTQHVLAELNRCILELGFVAAYAAPDPSGKKLTPGMQEAYWHPLYERCEQLAVPLIVHGTTSFDQRFRGIPFNYQMSFAIEQYVAHQCLRWSDVFDRYPQLKVIICHCGSVLDRFLPYDTVHIPQRNLRDNLFFDSCAYDNVFLEAAIKQRGVDQVCFGSEAPGSGSCVRREGPGTTADDLVPVINGFDFLTEADKAQIFNGNFAKIFPNVVASVRPSA